MGMEIALLSLGKPLAAIIKVPEVMTNRFGALMGIGTVHAQALAPRTVPNHIAQTLAIAWRHLSARPRVTTVQQTRMIGQVGALMGGMEAPALLRALQTVHNDFAVSLDTAWHFQTTQCLEGSMVQQPDLLVQFTAKMDTTDQIAQALVPRIARNRIVM